MPSLSVEDLPRHLHALRRTIRGWNLLAAHAWLRIVAALRQAHGADLPEERFIDDPDIPPTFAEACRSFQESLHELNELDRVTPDFPWLWCGGQTLASFGPPPDLDGWLESFPDIASNEWQARVVDPFLAQARAASDQLRALHARFEQAKEDCIAASPDRMATRLRVTRALKDVHEEDEQAREGQAQRRQRLHQLLAAAGNATGPGTANEPAEQWTGRLAERLAVVGIEVRAQRWEDWLQATAAGDPEIQGFADLMLAGDQGALSEVTAMLPDLPSVLNRLREWLKSLARDWPKVFDRGWLAGGSTANSHASPHTPAVPCPPRKVCPQRPSLHPVLTMPAPTTECHQQDILR